MNLQIKERYVKNGSAVLKQRRYNNRKLWNSRLLSALTIVLVIVAASRPALAQFQPPTTVTEVPCVGFFCNVADKVTANSLFSPMKSVINGLFSIVNLAVGGLYMVRGYAIVKKIDRNQEEWKQDAFNIGTSLAVIFIVYFISLAFLS